MDSSLETLKSQLLQLKNLHEAGALPMAEYKSGKAALERRLLDAVLASPGPAQTVSAAASPATAQSATASGAAPSRRLLALLGVAVFAVAIGGYTWTGSPSLLGGATPVAGGGREAGAAPHAVGMEQITEMTQRLAQRLEKQPQDAQGWAMLGRSYAVLGRNDEAVRAFQAAISQQDDDATLFADYADALAVQNKRVIAGEPMKWVRRALEIDPKNIKALALAGTDAFDRRDFAGAVQFWEKVLEFGPSDAGFVQQVKASVAEARERAGALDSGPRVAQAPAAPPAAGANTNVSPPNQGAKLAASASASVSGTVSLSAALAAKAGADDTVFIFARRAEGSRMPLALLRKRVRDLPLQFTLDDSMAMSPAAKLSGAPRVIVGARISRSGNAMPAPGDLVGQVGPVALGSAGLSVEIGEQVKP
jgi:cytochrome c-type biogenesis protein CcmH